MAAINGGKWGPSGTLGTDGGVVTWSFTGSGLLNSTGIGSFFSGQTVGFSNFLSFDYTAVWRAAFDAWSKVANIEFIQVQDGGGHIGFGSFSDIRVSAASIDGDLGIAGSAFFPNSGGSLAQSARNGDVVIDSTETTLWNTETMTFVAIHEIGHTIGLLHDNSGPAIMNATFNPSNPRTELQSLDISNIRVVYGAQDFGASVYTMPVSLTNMQLIESAPNLTINGNFWNNSIFGAGGSDIILGLGGIDNLFGNDGDDSLDGGTGNDALLGGAGDDTLFGGIGEDTLNGGENTDMLYGGVGADTLNGGDGLFDIAFYSDSSQGVIVDLEAGTGLGGTAEGDTLVGVERLVGSDFDDALSGDAANNELFGGDGNDMLFGGGGSDGLYGGAGTDATSFADSLEGVIIDLAAGTGVRGFAEGDTFSGIENVVGSSDSDTINGNSSDNDLVGGLGNDTLRGREGTDLLHGGLGADTLDGGDNLFDIAFYNDSAQEVIVDLEAGTGLRGTAEGDTLISIERLGGSDFGDALLGSAANNELFGGDGNDILVGRGGNDTLVGGSGNDTFTFAAASGDDVITDFVAGAGTDDVVRLQGLAIDTFAEVQAASSLFGTDNTLIDLGGGNSLLIGGVVPGDLNADDFTFV